MALLISPREADKADLKEILAAFRKVREGIEGRVDVRELVREGRRH